MPYTLEDSMRVHDQAMMDWIGTFRCDYNDVDQGFPNKNNVPAIAVLASPDRAAALVAQTLVARGWIGGADAETMRTNAEPYNVFPLPIITVTRLDPTPDPELSRAPGFIPRLAIDQATQQYVPHPWPRFYFTQYTVSIRCLKRYTDNLFRAWVFAAMGKQGSAHNETMIPVKHVEPWGEMIQRCRFDGSVDTSDLEGENIRFITTEYNFTLRTLVMHLPAAKTDFIDKIATDAGTNAAGFADTNENIDIADAPAFVQSKNLWAIPLSNDRVPREWPKDGAATVRVSTIYPGARKTAPGRGLTISVGDDSDAVELFERMAKLDTANQILISLSFRYVAGDDVTIELNQRDPNADVLGTIFQRTLPATSKWKRVQIVTLATKTLFSAHVRGIDGGDPREITLVDLDIRYMEPQPLTGPTITTPGDPVVYEWAGLTRGAPYVFRAGVTSGSADVTVENDSSAPTDTQVAPIDAAVNVGVAVLVSPVGTSVRVSVPATLSLAGASLSGYAGHHNGNEV